jgi:hypothetical protein
MFIDFVLFGEFGVRAGVHRTLRAEPSPGFGLRHEFSKALFVMVLNGVSYPHHSETCGRFSE